MYKSGSFPISMVSIRSAAALKAACVKASVVLRSWWANGTCRTYCASGRLLKELKNEGPIVMLGLAGWMRDAGGRTGSGWEGLKVA